MQKEAIKYLASYFKSDWTLQDYPLTFRHWTAEDLDPDFAPSHALIPWTAQIINWFQMGGYGNTKEEAYADLEEKFRKFKAAHAKLPRPGTGAPLEWATTVEVERFDAIATDFLEKVLGFEEQVAIVINDESSLFDFGSIDESLEKIREVYAIDVSDVEGANLARIFARIAETQSNPR